MFKLFVVALAICAGSGVVEAAGQNHDGVRNIERIDVGSARSHVKRSKARVIKAPRAARYRAAPRDEPWDNRPWTGTRTDAAGNPYVYFRTGVGTPFPPGTTLR